MASYFETDSTVAGEASGNPAAIVDIDLGITDRNDFVIVSLLPFLSRIGGAGFGKISEKSVSLSLLRSMKRPKALAIPRKTGKFTCTTIAEREDHNFNFNFKF